MENQNLLVTGGSGFIGSNFIHYMLKNSSASITNLDKLTYAGNNENHKDINTERYEFVHGDICNQELVENLLFKNKINKIVNFAAESHVDRSIENPDEFLTTNILGTYNLLQCSQKYYEHCKDLIFLHVSTDEVYGSLQADDDSFKETNQFLPNSPYAASKASSDMLVRAWHHTYKLPTLTTNCSNNYGPFQFPEKLIPLVINNAISGEKIPIYGDGSNIRDWLYVEDHCSAINKVLEKGKIGEIYNIGGNNEMTNLEIINKICEILDEMHPIAKKKIPIVNYSDLITFVTDRPGHDFRYSIDSSKIMKELNWKPATGFDKGIRKTIDWYLNNQNWINSIRNI